MSEKIQFKLDKVNKVLFIKGVGAIGPADAESFIKNYNNYLSSINASEYTLEFDCVGFKVAGKDRETGTDMVPMLKACIEMYKKDGFKNVIFICTGNVIMGVQLKRLGREVGLINMEVKM
ncbi:MAG: hypothetical protein GX258_11195 [Clostridiales bacterium]|jgi:hypothetical protein|nr:hypothetical protein [Clostridiales bacterium]